MASWNIGAKASAIQGKTVNDIYQGMNQEDAAAYQRTADALGSIHKVWKVGYTSFGGIPSKEALSARNRFFSRFRQELANSQAIRARQDAAAAQFGASRVAGMILQKRKGFHSTILAAPDEEDQTPRLGA